MGIENRGSLLVPESSENDRNTPIEWTNNGEPIFREELSHGEAVVTKKATESASLHPWISLGYGKRFEGENEPRELEIVFSKVGKSISINDLLPSRAWRIVEVSRRSEMVAIPQIRSILIPRDTHDALPEQPSTEGEVPKPGSFLSRDGAFLFLLHEIGHAYYHEQAGLTPQQYEEMNQLKGAKNHPLSPGLENYSEVVTNKYAELVIKDERAAWAYALKTLRNLKQQGIDLEENLSTQEVLGLTKKALGTHVEGSKGLPALDLKGRKIPPSQEPPSSNKK